MQQGLTPTKNSFIFLLIRFRASFFHSFLLLPVSLPRSLLLPATAYAVPCHAMDQQKLQMFVKIQFVQKMFLLSKNCIQCLAFSNSLSLLLISLKTHLINHETSMCFQGISFLWSLQNIRFFEDAINSE